MSEAMAVREIRKTLLNQKGVIDIYLALTIALITLLPLTFAGSQVIKAAHIQTVLQQGQNMAAQAIQAAGGYTNNTQAALKSYLESSGLDPAKTYISVTPGPQGYGSDNLSVVLGYDFDVVVPGTPWKIWHSYVEAGTPRIASRFVSGTGTDSSGYTTPTGLTGVRGGTDNPDPPPPPPPLTSAITVAVNPSPVSAGQAVTVSGTVNIGGSPAPAGTSVSVSVSGTSITASATTDNSGNYSCTITSLTSAGNYTITATSGTAQQSTQLTVLPAQAANINLSYPPTVTVGQGFTISGAVSDEYGNTVSDGTQVTVTSSDTTVIPNQVVTTAGGGFSISVAALSTVNPVIVTFASGGATSTADITPVRGQATNITITPSATGITAGQQVTFTGRVLSYADTPVAAGTSVGIGCPVDNAFPVTVQTADDGSFTTGPLTLTRAGTITVTAGTQGLSGTISASTTVSVQPGTPAKINDLKANPNPVFQGVATTVSGMVTDQYGNPVSGVSITIDGTGLTTPVSTTTLATGAFTATVTFNTPGTQVLQVKYNGNVLQPGGIYVQVAPQGSYTVTPTPAQTSCSAGQNVTLSFIVTDSSGAPANGLPVDFSVTPQAASLSTTTATTDANGLVQVTVTPTAAGIAAVTATVAGCGGTASISVSAGVPYQISNVQVTPSFVQVNASPGPVVSGIVLDRYGNPVPNASITVSGGYGPNATGTTNAAGTFSVNISPTNLGGPYSITVNAATEQGNVNCTPPNVSLTVVQYPPSTITMWQVHPEIQAFTGQLIPIACQLFDQNGRPWNGQNVTFSVITNKTATLYNLTPSGPAGSGTGTLVQTTGTYGDGQAAVNVIFDQPGSQTVLATFQNTVQQVTITVYPGNVSQIAWNPVQPGTTVTAGTKLTVSGLALNSMGQGVPDGTQIVLSMPGTSVTPVTTYTTTNNGQKGYFTAQLTVTNAGSWFIQAKASGQTFQYGMPITVTAGEPAISNTIIMGAGTYQKVPIGTTVGFLSNVLDAYWNPVPNATVNYSITASNGGVVPSPINQPAPTNGYGQTGVYQGPFNIAGTYTVTATCGSLSSSVTVDVV
ncbi:MAG: beta strand repeat-containing protein, partial [Bacillota bacterium]